MTLCNCFSNCTHLNARIRLNLGIFYFLSFQDSSKLECLRGTVLLSLFYSSFLDSLAFLSWNFMDNDEKLCFEGNGHGLVE